MREYHMGYLARIKHLPRDVNPMPRGVRYDQWEAGWLDADDYINNMRA